MKAFFDTDQSMKYLWTVLVCVFVVGCVTAQTNEKLPPAEKASDFYPVALGNAWAHLVTSHDTNEQVLVTSRIAKADPEGFVITTGAQNVAIARKPDGFFKPQSGYYILKDPIQPGAVWKMRDTDGVVTINAVAKTTTVAAGKFRNCILVTEEIPGSQRAEIVYAPGVGPISMKVYSLEIEPPLLLVSSELKGYQIQ